MRDLFNAKQGRLQELCSALHEAGLAWVALVHTLTRSKLPPLLVRMRKHQSRLEVSRPHRSLALLTRSFNLVK